MAAASSSVGTGTTASGVLSSPPTFPLASHTGTPESAEAAALSAVVQGAAQIASGRYVILRRLGSGAFGDIYLGYDLVQKEEVAIKLEAITTKTPQLQYESRIYTILQSPSETITGVSRMRWFGKETTHNCMVIDCLGPSLEDLFTFCSRKFTIRTICMLADQMISRIEHMHSRGLVHRDIKPDNFLIGLNRQASVVHIIDFGLAKPYRDPRTKVHIPFTEGNPLTGTARYASINTHHGFAQSRRDDLEALGFILTYFVRGVLPWQGIKGEKKEKYKKIKKIKIDTNLNTLCKGNPVEFTQYLQHCRDLPFDQAPNYIYLRTLFRDLFAKQKCGAWDYIFDWTPKGTIPDMKEASSTAPTPTAAVASSPPIVSASRVSITTTLSLPVPSSPTGGDTMEVTPSHISYVSTSSSPRPSSSTTTLPVARAFAPDTTLPDTATSTILLPPSSAASSSSSSSTPSQPINNTNVASSTTVTVTPSSPMITFGSPSSSSSASASSAVNGITNERNTTAALLLQSPRGVIYCHCLVMYFPMDRTWITLQLTIDTLPNI